MKDIKRKKVLLVAGARPNFMKISPIYVAMKKSKRLEPVIVHTGQHYDKNMSQLFFEDFKLPKPHIYLGVGSGSHAGQTAKIMTKFERICLQKKPDLVLVVGDVNSTLACSIVASKLLIPVAHVEAGLRSFDRTMPEEINRIVTDSISDYLFTTCRDGDKNLKHEGIDAGKIFFTGNTMIDTLKSLERRVRKMSYWREYGREYALITLHRPSNVDKKESLLNILKALYEIQKRIKIVFPIHPRTRKSIAKLGLVRKINEMKNLMLIEPIGYVKFMNIMIHAKLVLTDSGGIQEETTVLEIPCLTLRKNTERPVTVYEGTNILVGADSKRIVREVNKILSGRRKKGRIPKFWDGRASQRIVNILEKKL